MKKIMTTMCAVLITLSLLVPFAPVYTFAEEDNVPAHTELETKSNSEVLKLAIEYDLAKSNCKQALYCLLYSLDDENIDQAVSGSLVELKKGISEGQSLIIKNNVPVDQLNAMTEKLRNIYYSLDFDPSTKRFIDDKASATVAYENLVDSIVANTVRNKKDAQRLIDSYNDARADDSTTALDYSIIANNINYFIRKEQSSAIMEDAQARTKAEQEKAELEKQTEVKEEHSSTDLKPFIIMGAIVLGACVAFLVISVKKTDE